MSGSSRRTRGLLAAGVCLITILLLNSCGDSLTTPHAEQHVTGGVPLADFSSVFDDFDFLGFVEDVGGVNDNPAQSDLNAFTRADNVTGKIAVKWVWDDVDSWTGSGQTGDACALFDTDADGKANYAVCVRITNPNGDPTQTVQLDPGSPNLYSCGDNKVDRCSQPVNPASLNGTICEVARVPGESFFLPGGGDDSADTYAACSIPLAAISTAATPNLLNVCSFPSGEPNSNPFDCVVTPGAGFLIIEKITSPDQSGETFTFTISPAPVGGGAKSITDNTAGADETALLSAAPATNYSITEGTLPAGWQLADAACVLQKTPPQSTGTKVGNAVTGIRIESGETTVCTFTNSAVSPSIAVVKTAQQGSVQETGGTVAYDVVVTNTSANAVTLNTLVDNVFGDLNGQGTCNSVGNPFGSISAGSTYTCSFSGTLPAASAGDEHVNEVTATASNIGGSAVATDTAKVTYSDVAPTVTVLKTAQSSTVPETGGNVTFDVLVTNTSPEAVTLTSLVDDQFGDLDGQGDCDTSPPPALTANGGTYSCSFTGAIPAGNSGGTHTNVVTATVQDNDGTSAQDDDSEVVTYSDVAPTLTVLKTAQSSTVPETGGNVTFDVLVTNTSPEAVTLTSLVDDQFGNLDGQGDCDTSPPPALTANGGTYSCSFTGAIPAGNADGTHTNVVTATVQDNDGTSAQNSDNEVVTYTDVAPTVTVLKTAQSSTVPETGGNVVFDVLVTNTSPEAVTLTSLVDDQFGDLDGQGTCDASPPPALTANGGTYSCSFTGAIPAGNSGATHTNVVTATVQDNDGTSAQANDNEVVTYSDVAPMVTVLKTAQSSTVAETGGNVTFDVLVTNTSAEAVTLTSLVDDQFGDLDGQGTCDTSPPPALTANGGTYSCSFTGAIPAGNSGGTHTNVVTATAQDNDGTSAQDDDNEVVTYSDVLPDITVTKSAIPTNITGETGAFVFAAMDTFPRGASGGGGGPIFASATCDTEGPNDQPAQVDLNCFARADNQLPAGRLGLQWSWDDTDAWTGSGQTGDACALLDTNSNSFADYALCVRITNASDGSIVPVTGAAPLLYSCGDKRNDRCAQKTAIISHGTTTCSVDGNAPEAFPGVGDDGADVLAQCDVQLSAIGSPADIDLLNVCSFPSGSPNSNAFDCVVTPGVGFIQLIKVTTPDALAPDYFGFTASSTGASAFATYLVQAGATTAQLPLAPGTDYSLAETLPVNWSVASVACSLNGSPTGTAGATGVTGVTVASGQTTVCTFTNDLSLSGDVEFTVTVTNNSLEAVSLFSLIDSVFGDLNGQGTGADQCQTGGTILNGTPYQCKFTKTLTGVPGDEHKNKVTAVGKDNEDNSDTEDSNEVTVTFGPQP